MILKVFIMILKAYQLFLFLIVHCLGGRFMVLEIHGASFERILVYESKVA